ncbi:hypothetical protein AB4Y44_21650 [Paraburkholderia sp. BR10937]|uniref:hypothetical protein n=1 Tax=Paraburkholderia sp. BR10937 TaxID=3236994 RepID=UPI0034D36195
MTPELEQDRDSKFHELTVALRAALQQIRTDPGLPASVAQVARMASCSRGLLYTDDRRWVVRRIEKIKKLRRLRDKKVHENGAEADKVEGGVPAQLAAMRRENAQLFHECKALKGELRAAQDENEQLSRNLKSSEEQLYALREEVRRASGGDAFRRRTKGS